MTQILDRIAQSRRSTFRPASPDDYFALRLATRLGEPAAAAHYAELISHYPREKLIRAFHEAMDAAASGGNPGHLFHDYLPRNGGNGHIPHIRLVAVRVERRTIATASFVGTHLDGRRVLHLSSNAVRAEDSTASFIRSVLSEADCSSVGIENAPGKQDSLRFLLHQTIVAQIRATDISLWEISKTTLLEAFGHPPLRTRTELRELMRTIWPPNFKRSEICALDAIALGQFIQTERLFNNF